jgi:PAS domain-containing protein
MTDSNDATSRAALLSTLEDLAEARAQAHAYRAVADGLVSRLTAQAVVTDADGIVREVNDAALHLLGSRREDVLGHDAWRCGGRFCPPTTLPARRPSATTSGARSSPLNSMP